MRGALGPTMSHFRALGIIPACAGSTSTWRGWSRLRWDHPRMCGEHTFPCRWIRVPSGSSPHVRGARALSRVARRMTGIIPACAGSTAGTFQHRIRCRDHPRMCGEHRVLVFGEIVKLGSSPHVRGARHVQGRDHRRRGIIPACAGSTSPATPMMPSRRDHPRMCGEHHCCCSFLLA